MTDADAHRADLPPVGETAVGVAAIRALESQRDDRLFTDPLAARFVAASGRDLAARERAADADAQTRHYWDAIQRWVVVRTRFLDDVLLRACGDGCRQVVIVAAGLDARAFRLAWPKGVRLFELDLPEVLDFKADVVRSDRARCERIVAPCDLRLDWPAALRAAGLRSEPTVWIAEGLLVYLSDEENDQLIDRIGTLSAPGSVLGLTLRRRGPTDDVGPGAARFRGLWRSGGVADPAAWLAGHGWHADVYDAPERAAAYGRPWPNAVSDGSTSKLVEARFVAP